MASLLGIHDPKELIRRRCPFCPASIKRTFDDIGLFQHCIAVSGNNVNPAIVRAHCGLLNALKGKLNNSAPTARDDPAFLLQAKNMIAQPQKNAPPMPMSLNMPDKKQKSACDHIDSEVKAIWPWMGILMHVNYEQIARNYGNGIAINDPPTWNAYLKSYFAYLNPRSVQAFRIQGVAVLDFGHDLLGYFDAQDFQKGFAQRGRGKVDFESRIKHSKEQVQELFGWIADKNDYDQRNSVGQYLRERGTFRSEPHFHETWTEQHDILLQDVQAKLQEKNMKLMVLGTEVCSLRTSVYQKENRKYAAEGQLLLMESQHKKELNAIIERLNTATNSYNDELVKEKEKNNSLQVELRKSQEKCKHLEENAQNTSDETLIPKLIDLFEEKEALQDTLDKLCYKERDINDKLQSAMEAAKEVLQLNSRPIGIKRVGLVEEGPWRKAFAEKFKDLKGDRETICTKTINQWNETYLRDPHWHPYKPVQLDNGKCRDLEIDTNDEKLAKLSEEFGEEVQKTVVDALNELAEFNASGRYSVGVPWNFDKGRAARLDEVIKYLSSDCSKKRKSSL